MKSWVPGWRPWAGQEGFSCHPSLAERQQEGGADPEETPGWPVLPLMSDGPSDLSCPLYLFRWPLCFHCLKVISGPSFLLCCSRFALLLAEGSGDQTTATRAHKQEVLAPAGPAVSWAVLAVFQWPKPVFLCVLHRAISGTHPQGHSQPHLFT